MRKSPSLTAMVVAACRAVTGTDRVAPALLPVPVGSLLRAAERGVASSAVLSQTVRLLSGGLVDHVMLRTLAIDAVVARAVHEGARQLVVLGAGLDARAWRMNELADVDVFEIDHPSTQAYKRTSGSRARAKTVHFVGVDFERHDPDARLASAGHRSDVPTMWIWEGVTPYLTQTAIASTLVVIASRSYEKSVLAMTYATADLMGVGRRARAVIGTAFHAIGEPLFGLMTSEDAAAQARKHGFVVTGDSSSSDWARAVARPVPMIAVAERLLVAQRAMEAPEKSGRGPS